MRPVVFLASIVGGLGVGMKTGNWLGVIGALITVFVCLFLVHVVGSPARKSGLHSFGEEIGRLFDEREGEEGGGGGGCGDVEETEVSDLADEECKLLNYFASITVDLKSVEDKWAVWSMVGGGKPGVGQQEQLSFTAVRYHAR